MPLWSSWSARHPVKVKVAGSSPVSGAKGVMHVRVVSPVNVDRRGAMAARPRSLLLAYGRSAFA